MIVTTPDESWPVSVAELELEIQRRIPSAEHPAAMQLLVGMAAAVRTEFGEYAWTQVMTAGPDAHRRVIRAVVLRAAASRWNNPADRHAYTGPEGLSFTPAPALLARMITPDDMDRLMSVKLSYEPGFG